MSIYRGLNFGPTLGPIGKGVERGIQGRWVYIEQLLDTPLASNSDRRDEWGWWEPAEPVMDLSPIGGGEGGTSFGRGTRRWFPPPPPPPDDCPRWTSIAGPGRPFEDKCSEAWKTMIFAAYKDLSNSVQWANFLAQFDGGTLFECVRRRGLCDFELDCDPKGSQYLKREVGDVVSDNVKPYYFSFTGLAFGGEIEISTIRLQLAYMLLRSCDVPNMEASLMSEIAFEGAGPEWGFTKEDVWENLLAAVDRGIMQKDDIEDSYGRRRTIYFGKYLWYDPAVGECGPVPLIDIVFPVVPAFRMRWKLF